MPPGDWSERDAPLFRAGRFTLPHYKTRSRQENAKFFHKIILRRRIWGMKIKPLSDRVLVLRIEEDEKTSGGIIIPDTAKEKPQEGKVVAAGPGRLDENGKRIRMAVKKNDRVLFGKYAGTEIQIDGVEHIIMREDDIVGIVGK